MSILSYTFLGLSAVSSVFIWLFVNCTRRYTVLLCNIAFLFLLRANLLDVIYVVVLTLYTWLMGFVLSKLNNKKWVLLFVVVPVLGLCYFKYAGYLFPDQRIIMPLGLSFYTFKAISYLVDVSRGIVESKNIICVFDYIIFFPAFMAGPIHRSKPFFEELEKKFTFEYRDQKNGFIQACLGLFQKFVFADQLNYYVKLVLDNPELSGWYMVLGMLLYSFQIYVDFDAYSNVAIGIARMMGFHLERNFHSPYLGVSLRDFWRRWHISLSSWLRDYVYIPLGGSQKGTIIKWINTIIIFLVSGIWHGSTMMFVIWGLGHGIVMVIEDMIRKVTGGVKSWMKWFAPLGIIVNFIIVSILWVFFRSSSMEVALNTLNVIPSLKLSEISLISYEAIGMTLNEWYWMWIIIGITILTDILRYFFNMIDVLSKQFILFRWIFYIILIVLAIIFGMYGPGYHPSDFIYVTF